MFIQFRLIFFVFVAFRRRFNYSENGALMDEAIDEMRKRRDEKKKRKNWINKTNAVIILHLSEREGFFRFFSVDVSHYRFGPRAAKGRQREVKALKQDKNA